MVNESDEIRDSSTPRDVLPPDVAHEPLLFQYQLFIRDYNQVAVAFLLALSFLGCAFYFSVKAHVNRGIVDIDKATPVEVEYLVDINKAAWPEIANLPGIGPKLANAIVHFREINGPYGNHDELIKVSGIGDAKLENLRPFLAPIRYTASE